MITFNNLGNLGRLANQMFQYASLKGIANNRGFEFSIPPESDFGNTDIMVRNERLNLHSCFYVNEHTKVGTYPNQIFPERMHTFDQELFDKCPDNVDLFGYYQSPKYFNHIEDEIRKDFAFSKELIDSCQSIIDDFVIGGDAIALHIRRTDYNANPNHPLQDMEYYKNALKELPDVPVLVFSDDPKWCHEQELFLEDKFAISDNDGDFDLCLMTLCKYHIIANSSFSWWGAWLGKSDKIIAPKNWFGAQCAHKSVDDMVFGDWSWL